jgi:hypothetical protein
MPFLIYDSGPTAIKRMLIFASQEGLHHLAQSRHWFLDGTFNVAPHIFDQLYVIRSSLGETCVSCIYALLPGRTQELYEEMFRAISDASEKLGASLDPEVVTADFEKAVWLAATAVFGQQLQLKGCFFHLCQSTWRKIQTLGLATMYKENDEAKQFCGMIDGLAFLPLSDINEGKENFVHKFCVINTVT